MGIGGDHARNVLWRPQHGDLGGHRAKLLVVMAGTNNLWGRDADPVKAAGGVKAVIDMIRPKQPDAKILLMSILPSGEKPNPGGEKRAETNKLISTFAGGSVEHVDIWDRYLDADGIISKEVIHDFLHLVPKGHGIWAESIAGRVRHSVSGKR